MIFISITFGGLILGIFYLHRQADKFKFTKIAFVFLIISIMMNISLAQNYTQSLIPGVNDGIGISNRMAEWIITDSGWGKSWSVELFKKAYDMSQIVSIVALLLFMFSVLLETRRNRTIN